MRCVTGSQCRVWRIGWMRSDFLALQCLPDLLQPYAPARQLGYASDAPAFVIPCVNTETFGERSFSYAGPSVWNSLSLKHSAILILSPFSNPSSRLACSIIICKLCLFHSIFYTASPSFPLSVCGWVGRGE